MKKIIILIVTIILIITSLFIYFNLGKEKEYTVIFDSNGGSIINSAKIKSGGKVSKPTDPVKEGYRFINWMYNDKEYNFTSEVTQNMTLKANWEEIVYYTVTVNLEGKDYKVTAEKGSYVTSKNFDFPKKVGYKVVLYINDLEKFDYIGALTRDWNIRGVYEKQEIYTVYFNSNGGTAVDSIKVYDGDTISPPVTTKNGSVFDGWYLGKEKFNFENPISGNMALDAKWK